MKIFQFNNVDAIFWCDIDEYHNEHPEKKRVYVWHEDSMALLTFDVNLGHVQVTNDLGGFVANGNFAFIEKNGTFHYVFKDSTKWKIWIEMNDYLKEHEIAS